MLLSNLQTVLRSIQSLNKQSEYNNLKMIREPEFFKWIKIRIGQPLTAVDMNQRIVIFGSISGYIGIYRFDNNTLKYIESTFEQIIRALHLNGNRAFGAIGDREGLLLDCDTFKYQLKKIQRNHNNTICSYSMSFLNGEKEVIFCAYPTQKKDTLQNQLDRQKNTLYQVNLYTNQIAQHKDFNLPQVSVPFDFDGRRVLWMQYKEQGFKQFQFYDLQRREIFRIAQFPKSYQFLSHGRLYGNELIFVENNKNVKTFNMETRLQTNLYQHTSSIIAFNIQRRANGYQLASVDYNSVLCVWNPSGVKRIKLLDCVNVPLELRNHKYLFDMGYPYYVKVFGEFVAVTTDLGLMIFRL